MIIIKLLLWFICVACLRTIAVMLLRFGSSCGSISPFPQAPIPVFFPCGHNYDTKGVRSGHKKTAAGHITKQLITRGIRCSDFICLFSSKHCSSMQAGNLLSRRILATNPSCQLNRTSLASAIRSDAHSMQQTMFPNSYVPRAVQHED